MKTLYLDCFAGVSGDMFVGALADLGVPEDVFQSALCAIGLPGVHAHFRREARRGIEGVKFDVHTGHAHDPGGAAHTHDAGHASHVHGRDHAQIRELVAAAGLAGPVKQRVLAVFERIAIAEGRIHGVPPEAVGFHEVGAEDSIADIVCACAGLDALGVARVLCSPLQEGSGWVRCAHGRYPLPAPATAEILKGIPLRQLDEEGERITPTGAALVAEFAAGFGPMPPMQIERIGYGVGTRDPDSHPNILRAMLGETESAARGLDEDTIVCLETNLDDQSPEWTGAAMDRLLAAGALDVSFTPAQMKKNRPGILLSVLCEPARAEELARLVLRETSAFGLRRTECRRWKLPRHSVTVETPFGAVQVKLGTLDGAIVQVAPEFESVRRVAGAAGVAAKEVFFAALAAARSVG